MHKFSSCFCYTITYVYVGLNILGFGSFLHQEMTFKAQLVATFSQIPSLEIHGY